MKTRTLIMVVGILVLMSTASLVLAAGTPIADSTPLPVSDPVGHSLKGLQIQRGNGFVTVSLPRSADHRTAWGIHGFVTLIDADITAVTIPSWGVAEGNGDDGVAGIIVGDPIGISDEIDWQSDSVKVPSGQARGVVGTNEAEFWMATNSGADAFTFNLSYGFCPYMRIDLVTVGQQSYNIDTTQYENGSTPFNYGYDIPLTTCRILAIDIKPGSYPNSINLGSNGVVPVAILSSATFDATQVDPGTVELAGSAVAVKGKGNRLLARVADVNEDGLLDLMMQVETENFDPNAFQGGVATLTGFTFDGLPFQGSDTINIVPIE